MPVAVVGLSHKTAPVEVREKLSIPEEKRVAAIQQLCSYPHIQEATVLCTCNRMEVYFVTGETHHGIREVTAFLSEHSGIPLPQLRPYLFTLLHQDAVMHLLRVAAGLDSLVLGEGQILAQVKHCHKLGQEAKGTGTVLNRLLRGRWRRASGCERKRASVAGRCPFLRRRWNWLACGCPICPGRG